MPLILCIETATTMCSVALGRDGKLLASKEMNAGYTHAENLTVFIEEVMKEANVKFADLDAVAVSKGPGSYTGLRIGVSAAKGLCYGLDKPLIAINTLRQMAANRKSDSRFLFAGGEAKKIYLCPMIDARRMEVYTAVYDKNGSEVEPVSAKVIDENSFADLLNENKIIFFGDGASKCKEALSHYSSAIFIDNIYPSAKAMLELAEEKFTKKEFEDVAYFEPFYLKDFVSTKKS
jgi:tRNA threonylcarbamoyladenosine biosynthesis protein TsaB